MNQQQFNLAKKNLRMNRIMLERAEKKGLTESNIKARRAWCDIWEDQILTAEQQGLREEGGNPGDMSASGGMTTSENAGV
jgi:hypothetical protein